MTLTEKFAQVQQELVQAIQKEALTRRELEETEHRYRHSHTKQPDQLIAAFGAYKEAMSKANDKWSHYQALVAQLKKLDRRMPKVK